MFVKLAELVQKSRNQETPRYPFRLSVHHHLIDIASLFLNGHPHDVDCLLRLLLFLRDLHASNSWHRPLLLPLSDWLRIRLLHWRILLAYLSLKCVTFESFSSSSPKDPNDYSISLSGVASTSSLSFWALLTSFVFEFGVGFLAWNFLIRSLTVVRFFYGSHVFWLES